MASPQLENGFARVANEILEATAAAKLNGTQYAIIICVWRQTYGYQRKAHNLSESFISKATGMSRRSVQVAINDLIKSNIITVVSEPTFSTARKIAFQKDYEKWSIYPQMKYSAPGAESRASPGVEFCTSPGAESCTSPGAESCAQINILKNNIKKDTNVSDFIERNEPSEEFNAFWTAYPRRQAKKAFIKLKPDKDLLTVIIDAVKRQSETEDWQRDGGRFIPLPASYISGRRWEDEPGQQAEPKPKHRYLNRYYQ
ncbi:MAG: replication protein [Eubacteriales bacterium]|nr:replication protein [Eubacteriales bacterium]